MRNRKRHNAKIIPPRTFKVHDLITIVVREQRKFESDGELETKKKELTSLPPEIGHPIYAEAALPAHDSDFQWRVFYAGPLKLHWNAKGYHRLFDLEVDPEERDDLARRRVLLAQMIQKLAAYRATLPETAPAAANTPLDSNTRELLESLGYLESDEAAADARDEAQQ